MRHRNASEAEELQALDYMVNSYLQEAKDALDKQIEKAEQQKADPLAAVKKAAEMVEKLIQEQKLAKDMTEKENSPEKLKPAATLQKDVAKKTDEVKNLPLPESKDLKEALDKASDSTKKAADDLAKKDKPAAMITMPLGETWFTSLPDQAWCSSGACR